MHDFPMARSMVNPRCTRCGCSVIRANVEHCWPLDHEQLELPFSLPHIEAPSLRAVASTPSPSIVLVSSS